MALDIKTEVRCIQVQVTGGERRKTRNDFCTFTCKAAHVSGCVKLDIADPVNVHIFDRLILMEIFSRVKV